MQYKIIECLELAEKYYDKKTFSHALRVAKNAYDEAALRTTIDADEAYIVGLLHDIIEDTDCPQRTLNNIVGEFLFTYILDLTKKDDETYEEYIKRCVRSRMTKLVKQADMKDHYYLADTLTDKLKAKYEPMLHYFL